MMITQLHNNKFFSFLIVIAIVLTSQSVKAQGCVAVRHMGMCTATDSSGMLNAGQFQLTLGYRYLHSYKHFKGTEEQEERVEQHTEVVNKTSSMDITLSYAVNRRLILNVTMPVTFSNRSSLYEHDRQSRFTTRAYGIGDMRLTATYWILDPQKKGMKHNISIGGGIKIPTANEETTDVFYTANGPQERPVDQSIQPGDGGWGVNLEFQAYTHIAHRLYAYGNGFYLFNPMNTNGVRTYRDSLSPILANEAIMSITDQFMFRGGLSFYPMNSGNLNLALGARIEGVPVKDLFGKSEGFRRPGYVVSVEPSLTYRMKKKHEFNVSVPVALLRNRTQSLTDKETEQLTGNPRHGDAAFANYLLLITYAYKF